MNNEFDWANVFGSEPGGSTAAVGVDIPAEPHSISQNAQSDGQRMPVGAPAPAERMPVADGLAAESEKPVTKQAYVEGQPLKRTSLFLDPVSLAYLGAVDAMPAAWHVRRAVAMYVEGMVKPTVVDSPAAQSITLTPAAHALAVHVAAKLGVDVGQVVSASVLEQLEVMR